MAPPANGAYYSADYPSKTSRCGNAEKEAARITETNRIVHHEGVKVRTYLTEARGILTVTSLPAES